MDTSVGDASGVRSDSQSRSGPAMVFTPMVRDGLGWLRITEPQLDPRAACMSIAALIHLLDPGLPLSELEALAEPAVHALEDGAATVTVIDDTHRVDKTVLRPVAPASRHTG